MPLKVARPPAAASGFSLRRWHPPWTLLRTGRAARRNCKATPAWRKRISAVSRIKMLITTAAVSAVASRLLDGERGRRRRALARDKAIRALGW